MHFWASLPLSEMCLRLGQEEGGPPHPPPHPTYGQLDRKISFFIDSFPYLLYENFILDGTQRKNRHTHTNYQCSWKRQLLGPKCHLLLNRSLTQNAPTQPNVCVYVTYHVSCARHFCDTQSRTSGICKFYQACGSTRPFIQIHKPTRISKLLSSIFSGPSVQAWMINTKS